MLHTRLVCHNSKKSEATNSGLVNWGKLGFPVEPGKPKEMVFVDGFEPPTSSIYLLASRMETL